MATAAAQAEYLADAKELAADLEADGYKASFGKLAEGATSIDPPGDYVEIGTASVFPLEWDAKFSDDVRADDQFFIVSHEVDIENCTHMGGKASKIVLAKPFKPDGSTLVYTEIQVRGS